MFLVGRSLGGAVATAAVSKLGQSELDKIDGLIIENTFTSIDDMADRMFSVLAYLKRFVLTNHWRTIDLVKEITIPILYITGALDEIVHPDMTVHLHANTKKARVSRMWINPEGSHNDSWSINKDGYLRSTIGFMNEMTHDGQILRK